jgi:pimeloyl-ACP methyl ester carboxylesterase
MPTVGRVLTAKRSRTRNALRILLIAAAVLPVLALILALVYRESVVAQGRAMVVLGTMLDTPVLGDAAEWFTGEPRSEEEVLAGAPTTVVYPAGEGPWPALVFVTGADPLGRDNPTVGRLAEGLARAGYVVYVPDLPGMRLGEITETTADSASGVVRAAVEDEDTRDGRVGLAGVSVGASLVLLAAAEPDLRDRVTVVAGVAPYTDIREAVRIGTTDTYLRDDGELVKFEADAYLSLVIARSLLAGLPPEEGREILLALRDLDQGSPDPLAGFRACERAGDGLRALFDSLPPPGSDDPLALLRACSSDALSPTTRQMVQLLGNTDPARFNPLYAELPEDERARIEELSPITAAEDIAAPVRLASPPRDKYFPTGESYALAARVPEAEVLVTEALAHADPEPGDIPAYLELNGFMVDVLRESVR